MARDGTNYAPIPAWESGWLRRTFKAFFVQDRTVYNLPGNPIGQRYGIRADTTAEALHDWLRHGAAAERLGTQRARSSRSSGGCASAGAAS